MAQSYPQNYQEFLDLFGSQDDSRLVADAKLFMYAWRYQPDAALKLMDQSWADVVRAKGSGPGEVVWSLDNPMFRESLSRFSSAFFTQAVNSQEKYDELNASVPTAAAAESIGSLRANTSSAARSRAFSDSLVTNFIGQLKGYYELQERTGRSSGMNMKALDTALREPHVQFELNRHLQSVGYGPDFPSEKIQPIVQKLFEKYGFHNADTILGAYEAAQKQTATFTYPGGKITEAVLKHGPIQGGAKYAKIVAGLAVDYPELSPRELASRSARITQIAESVTAATRGGIRQSVTTATGKILRDPTKPANLFPGPLGNLGNLAVSALPTETRTAVIASSYAKGVDTAENVLGTRVTDNAVFRTIAKETNDALAVTGSKIGGQGTRRIAPTLAPLFFNNPAARAILGNPARDIPNYLWLAAFNERLPLHERILPPGMSLPAVPLTELAPGGGVSLPAVPGFKIGLLPLYLSFSHTASVFRDDASSALQRSFRALIDRLYGSVRASDWFTTPVTNVPSSSPAARIGIPTSSFASVAGAQPTGLFGRFLGGALGGALSKVLGMTSGLSALSLLGGAGSLLSGLLGLKPKRQTDIVGTLMSNPNFWILCAIGVTVFVMTHDLPEKVRTSAHAIPFAEVSKGHGIAEVVDIPDIPANPPPPASDFPGYTPQPGTTPPTQPPLPPAPPPVASPPPVSPDPDSIAAAPGCPVNPDCAVTTQCPGGGYSHQNCPNCWDLAPNGGSGCGPQDVFSTHNGVVTQARCVGGGYGCFIDVAGTAQDGTQFTTRYGHLDPNYMYAGVGDTISIGQPLARMDNTGASSGTHLHYEVRGLAGYALPAECTYDSRPSTAECTPH